MAQSRQEQVTGQLQALEHERGVSHEVTLLRLHSLDVVEQDEGLDALEVHLDEALSGGTLYQPERLSWCSEVGIDRFGIYAEVEVQTVRFKMRYISPGSFVMGSPEDEGHYEGEGPLHEVQLTKGFWLGDTPCTQALWKAVAGNNPSVYKGAQRPVEMVSWEDCQEFLQSLNGRAPSLEVQLPTEAQWEYACRAGTQELRYAPLETIAWYNDNSNGHTHPVGRKAPNAWGLYDMLGNVWEWCADWWEYNYSVPRSGVRGRSAGSRKE